jgi:hypothetical protein
MNIKEKFIELTSRTYPHGTEEDVFPLLNSELQKDEFDNLLFEVKQNRGENIDFSKSFQLITQQ